MRPLNSGTAQRGWSLRTEQRKLLQDAHRFSRWLIGGQLRKRILQAAVFAAAVRNNVLYLLIHWRESLRSSFRKCKRCSKPQGKRPENKKVLVEGNNEVDGSCWGSGQQQCLQKLHSKAQKQQTGNTKNATLITEHHKREQPAKHCAISTNTAAISG